MNVSLELSVPEGKPAIAYRRDFAAPVASLFRAHSDRDLLAQWVGPKEAGIKLTRFDFERGGGYAYQQVDGQGRGHVFNGLFHAIVENELIIQTKEFDGVLELVALESLVFTEIDGGSRLAGHAAYRSQSARDALASAGMEKVLVDGFSRLDEVLQGMDDAGPARP